MCYSCSTLAQLPPLVRAGKAPEAAERYATLARQLVRAIRGRRSQKAFSARIGYRSNIAQRWESGACFPTASVFLGACARVNPAAVTSFREFLKRAPAWLDERDPFTPNGVAAFLQDLRGKTPIGVLAERTGCNRYSVGRWLQGRAQPKLPELLALVEASSRRALDFIATLVDPMRLPSLAGSWAELQATRNVAYEYPWSHAVLRALELRSITHGRGSVERRIATALGIAEGDAKDALTALQRTGQVVRAKRSWRVTRVMAVDTSRDETRSLQLKDAWLGVARQRLRAAVPGTFGYSLFAVSHADLRRLRELHLEYVRAMQSIIASSEPAECVGLYCSQLCDLGARGAADKAMDPTAATAG
jgi:transcriptional regulator with XRE-family HTH domain